MRRHKTIDGRTIDLGIVSLVDQDLCYAILDRFSKNVGDEKSTADDFAEEVRDLVRNRYRSEREYRNAMSGTLGVLFRDAFYRLYAQKTGLGEEFLNRIVHDPARLLIDAHLCGWRSALDFAAAAGLEPSTYSLTRKFVFNQRTERDGSRTAMTVKRFRQTCIRLGVIPTFQIGEPGDIQTLTNTTSDPSSFTARERLLWSFIIPLVEKLKYPKQSDDDAHDLTSICKETALFLGVLYGIDDYFTLERHVFRLLKDVIQFLDCSNRSAEPDEKFLMGLNELPVWDTLALARSKSPDVDPSSVSGEGRSKAERCSPVPRVLLEAVTKVQTSVDAWINTPRFTIMLNQLNQLNQIRLNSSTWKQKMFKNKVA